jgi:hypothetical protein
MVLLLIAAFQVIFIWGMSFILKGNSSENGNKKLGWFVVLVVIPFTFAMYLLGK